MRAAKRVNDFFKGRPLNSIARKIDTLYVALIPPPTAATTAKASRRVATIAELNASLYAVRKSSFAADALWLALRICP